MQTVSTPVAAFKPFVSPCFCLPLAIHGLLPPSCHLPPPTLQAAAKPKPGAAQNLHFQFYRNPVEVLVGPSGKAEGLKVEITALKEGPDGQAVAVGTGG